MITLSYMLMITVTIVGSTSHTNIINHPEYIGTDVIPVIEVIAPRQLMDEIDSLSMVQGITVYGERDEFAEQGYRSYRRSFFNISALISEYAVYFVAAIVTVAFGAIALVKVVRHYHIHLAHQHKHHQLHEYYLWRKAYLEKLAQDRLQRRT